MHRALTVFSLAALLVGCGGTETAVGGVSQSEADALNNAAEILDQPSATGSLTALPPAKSKSDKTK